MERTIILKIKTKKQEKIYSNRNNNPISIDFLIYKTINIQNLQNATFKIYNLSKSDLNDLLAISFNKRYINKYENGAIIELYTGYDNDISLLFQGDLYTAIPKGITDKCLVISAKSCYYKTLELVSLSFNTETSFKNILEILANKLDIKLIYNSTRNKTIYNYTYNGNLQGALNQLTYLNKDVNIFYDNGVLYCNDINSENIYLLEVGKGIIGEPEKSISFLTLKILLNTKIRCGDWFRFEDNRLVDYDKKSGEGFYKYMNGVYRIWYLTHTGGSRLNDFYTEITAIKKGGVDIKN